MAATPGPWEVVTSDDPRGRPFSNYRSLVALISPGPYVAVVASGDRETTEGQRSANARLIAAAPDLLEVVRAVSEWRAACPSEHGKDETILAFDEAVMPKLLAARDMVEDE